MIVYIINIIFAVQTTCGGSPHAAANSAYCIHVRGTYGKDSFTSNVLTDQRTPYRKPNTALGDPWPATTIIPKITQTDNCGDYESELAVVIGKQAKNVSESEAMDYVLGYTAANDVSSRTSQLNQSQWSFSKGFDGSCPLGEFFDGGSVAATDDSSRSNSGLNIPHPRSLRTAYSRFQEWESPPRLSSEVRSVLCQ